MTETRCTGRAGVYGTAGQCGRPATRGTLCDYHADHAQEPATHLGTPTVTATGRSDDRAFLAGCTNCDWQRYASTEHQATVWAELHQHAAACTTALLRAIVDDPEQNSPEIRSSCADELARRTLARALEQQQQAAASSYRADTIAPTESAAEYAARQAAADVRDFLTVEPAETGTGWTVTVWTADGEPTVILRHRFQRNCEELAEGIRRALVTWPGFHDPHMAAMLAQLDRRS